MATEIKMYRVLQHDTEDQIRISSAFPSTNLEKTVSQLIDQYDRELNWCGGFGAGCEKYYKRLGLVDADTLAVVRLIYTRDAPHQRKEDKK